MPFCMYGVDSQGGVIAGIRAQTTRATEEGGDLYHRARQELDYFQD